MDITSRNDIREWLKRGKKKGAKWMISCCDTFDYEDYPVFVMKNDDIHEMINKYNGKNMQKVNEVYNLELDIEKQLNQDKAWNI